LLSTTTSAHLWMVATSISALPRKFEPMALMWQPSGTQGPCRTGSRLVVAVMRMSLSWAACSGRATGTISTSQRRLISSAKVRRFSSWRL